MAKPNPKRSLEALIKAVERNNEEIKKIRIKFEALEAAIQNAKDLQTEFKQRRAKRNSN
jgi:acyl-CoA hydrolase